MLSRAPQRVVFDPIHDSHHWDRYVPRAGDVVVATAPKCGTTWTQRIVNLLIFQSPAPVPIMQTSPWIECRFQMPIDVVIPMLEAQTHRRSMKSHLPFDALPVYDEVRYIHTARGGLDACFSFHNHLLAMHPHVLAANNGGDSAPPLPKPSEDQREFFNFWLSGDVGSGKSQADSFFDVERSYWSDRGRENVLFVHYNDLKADLSGEMKRIAAFLGIETPAALWPELVEAATFEAMKREGAALLPGIEMAFKGGHETFLNKGTNGRWRDVLSADDVARYHEKAKASLPPELYAWLENGRRVVGEPRAMTD